MLIISCHRVSGGSYLRNCERKSESVRVQLCSRQSDEGELEVIASEFLIVLLLYHSDSVSRGLWTLVVLLVRAFHVKYLVSLFFIFWVFLFSLISASYPVVAGSIFLTNICIYIHVL